MAKRRVLGALLALVLSVGLLGVAVPGLPGGGGTQAFAVTEASVRTESSITLTAEQTEFVIPLTIEHPEPFAGVETAIQCGEGVNITEVTYSINSSQAGPTDARGFTWFALFSGGNNFSGSVIATVHATYAGSENTSVVIDHSSFYTKEGAVFKTLNLPLRQEVVIEREGADNTAPPLEPPDEGGDSGNGNGSNGNGSNNGNNSSGSNNGNADYTPGAGNPPSGALISYNPPTSSAGNDSGGTSNTNNAANNNDANTADNPTTLTPEQTPLAAPNGANNIPGSNTQQTIVLSSLLFIALAAVAVLGFLLIAKTRRKQDEQQKED
ncbi:MAG: hypothetical protein LBC23_03195 [Coriobacteriales bacterium]|nr:hypothetical protein [Coriobacteriales bacterium]